MKIKATFRLIVVLICLFILQDKAYSQACEQLELLKEGTSYTLKNYNNKEKLTSTSKNNIIKVTNKDGGVEALVKNEIFDNKDKPSGGGEVTMLCKDDVIYIDLRSLLNQQSMAGFENMDMEIENNLLQLPSNLKPGQQLPDGNLKMRITSEGIKIATIELKIYNRNVQASEQITTEAGTFDTHKISYDMEMITTTIIPLKIISSTIEWYSVKYGVVRSESYNRNGKPLGYTVLTEFKQ
ncbi:MAG: hypothetical protein M3Q58_08030 [Bacteroidota bacterium]|nr:hypothetical protein [Bacteroidota bacterium]